MRKEDLKGRKFGRLTVVRQASNYVYSSGRQQIRWECVCECGNIAIVLASNLKSGDSKSCGCLSKEVAVTHNTTHGYRKHPLYAVWASMKLRCLNKKNTCYKYYGGKGVSICEEWVNSAETFINWALKNGWKKGLQIDRIDNDGNYTPVNCRFVSARQNCLNRRVLRKNNKSGYEGVTQETKNKKWRSRILVKGNAIRLGAFESKKDAVCSRNNYIIENNLENDYVVQQFK